MKGRNPNKKEKDHMDTVQQLGCIVCRNEYGVFSPAEIHHVYGKTKKNAHFRRYKSRKISLCSDYIA